MSKPKESKNQRRRAKKKAEKHAASDTPAPEVSAEQSQPEEPKARAAEVTLAYDELEESAQLVRVNADDVLAPLGVNPDDPLYQQFKDVLVKFQDTSDAVPEEDPNKPEVYYDNDEDIPDEEQEEESENRVSRKQRRKESKLSVAELKALVRKPELVEWTDTDASDPRLLVAIKAHRNIVPVPGHWSLKREYLSSKRGIEKPPFALPQFIVETGITEMRDALLEKQENQTLKQKQRERVQGKLGKLDIDYRKLYDAFYKFQKKPELTRYGEVYYEGKEYETNLKHLRPGELSDELVAALNIPPGAPPPWLINMQRWGPPPSYPALKVPGVNAPPPPGAKWGYNPGEWGKPPVGEDGKPLYGGDVFGMAAPPEPPQYGEPVEKTLWGEIEIQEEEEEEEEEDEEEEEEEEEEEAEEIPGGLETPSARVPASGFSSTVTSMHGAESVQPGFNLRKGAQAQQPEAEERESRPLYHVLEERSARNQGFFGSERTYDVGAAARPQNVPMLGAQDGRKRKHGDVDVSVDLDKLQQEGKVTKEELKRQYDAGTKQEANPWGGAGIDQDDLTAMLAEESRKRQKKEEDRRKRR